MIFPTMWYVRPAKAQISLRSAFATRLNVFEYNLEFLSLKGGCTGSSESTQVKTGQSWKSHVTAQWTLFTLLVRMRQTVSFRVISARLHVKGQLLDGCLTLHNGIWKTIKRKINLQIKIRQIVKLNVKCNKNK